jgi:RND superfamily putative drug exporter
LLVLGVGVAALAVLAVPVTSLELGLSNAGSDPVGSDTRVVYDTVADTFGPGVNGTLLVLADLHGSAQPQAAADAIVTELGTTEGVAKVAEARFSTDGDHALISVTPETGPSDPATTALVQDIRDQAGTIAATTGAEVQVAGATALGVDFSNQLAGAILPFALVVVGLSLVLLTLIFRSLLVPVVAALGYLLSLGVALGSTVAVFQWGWLGDGITGDAAGPLISFLPILVMAVLFGLAMDYQVFLVSRIHEAVTAGRDPRTAIREGVGQAGRVVVAAALIMISVFAGFAISGTATIRPLAFALAIGVLVDAFVVRMTLVPAALGLLGGRAWRLPSWLDRVLPHVDVEGGGASGDEEVVVGGATTTARLLDDATEALHR